jgi:DNA-binding NarL/FixJ family response regulator
MPTALVRTCRASGEALELARSFRPAVLIFDIHSGVEFGFPQVVEIKKLLPGTVMIMFTTFLVPQYQSRAEEIGIHYYFTKTGDFEPLLHAIEYIAQFTTLQRHNDLVNISTCP